ncbi:MAG: family 16 glycoside hydrolase [Verrucomicrobiota bacterium]
MKYRPATATSACTPNSARTRAIVSAVSPARIAGWGAVFAMTCMHGVVAATIHADAELVRNQTSPMIYGACIEDVNHEIYGGLYGQLLAGESFEEAAPAATLTDWATWGGEWKPSGSGAASEAVNVTAEQGAKIVKAQQAFTDGTIDCDLRFAGNHGERTNAGVIIRVNHAAAGADAFDGYEISLAADGKSIVLGKHRQNWQELHTAAVAVDPSQWQHLKVTTRGPQILIYLNSESKPVIDFTDAQPLPAGSIGLRTWGANAGFRNVETHIAGRLVRHSFTSTPATDVSACWDPFLTDSAGAGFLTDSTQAYNTRCSQRVEFKSGRGSVGVANRGLNRWGIAVEKDGRFSGRVYLRGEQLKGNVTVSLQNLAGSRVYASQTISGITGSWTKSPFSLTANASDPAARFVISIDAPGMLWIDQAVLMKPASGRFMGLPVREDIANAMVKGNLSFLRYGGTAVNEPGYRWKKMVGDPDLRPQYHGHWHPDTSNGFGIIEFVAFCERAGIEAAFAINVEESPQDMADMIEYFNGDVSTLWGKARAADGHPNPYRVKYIEIGNEEVIWGDIAADYDHYIERFKLLAAAMRAKDAGLQFINAAWWRGNNPNCEKVLKQLEGNATYWDFHPWADDANSGQTVDSMLSEARQLFEKWVPATKTKGVIFEENGNLHNQQRALGHATTLNAVRRHGDFVVIDCEANGLQPWRQNDNGWDQGHVFFTPSQVWGMPPYFAQQMASANHLPLVIASNIEGNTQLDVTATKSEDGTTVCLHVVNLALTEATTTIKVEHFHPAAPAAKVWTLSGKPDDANTPEQPTRVQPIESTIPNAGGDFSHTFPASSHTIIRLGTVSNGK